MNPAAPDSDRGPQQLVDSLAARLSRSLATDAYGARLLTATLPEKVRLRSATCPHTLDREALVGPTGSIASFVASAAAPVRTT